MLNLVISIDEHVPETTTCIPIIWLSVVPAKTVVCIACVVVLEVKAIGVPAVSAPNETVEAGLVVLLSILKVPPVRTIFLVPAAVALILILLNDKVLATVLVAVVVSVTVIFVVFIAYDTTVTPVPLTVTVPTFCSNSKVPLPAVLNPMTSVWLVCPLVNPLLFLKLVSVIENEPV